MTPGARAATYLPAHFTETRPDVLHDFVRAHPFATMITQGGGGMIADHLPMELDASRGPFGTLLAHVARANPVWRENADGEALVIFHGPQGYVSPGWYPSKAETGKVVPTWNYIVVHARGPLRVIDDPVWLRAFVARLTTRHEATRPVPWRIDDAPEDYVEAMVRGIVGLEIPLDHLVGKWKLSQNRTPADRAGVLDGLDARGDADSRALASAMRLLDR